MSRLLYLLLSAIAALMLVFAYATDRALLSSARRNEAATAAEKTRLTAVAVRAALDPIEKAVTAGEPVPGVQVWRLAPSPDLSLPRAGDRAYADRPRDKLIGLLSSDAVTGSGLPEAVVAALALDLASQDRFGARGRVAERLLSGALSVRVEDLRGLAALLGAADDPRIGALERLLAHAPDMRTLSAAPGFIRALGPQQKIVGWARSESVRIRYELDAGELLRRAGVARRAALSGQTVGLGLRYQVSVPDVTGLELSVAPGTEGRLRLHGLRVILWLAAIATLAAAVFVTRSLRSEARAVAREKAFLASVTHELRTPLASIRLFGETLAEGRGQPREYGVLVARESERLDELVERVLAATRVDEKPSFAPVLPAALIEESVALIAPRAARQETTVTWQADGDLPTALWDAVAVRRALLNLLDNAIRHGHRGGHVQVRAEPVAKAIQISVKDDGPGIARRERKGLFGRFERRHGDGAGLGLYLVDQVVRAHGGRIDLVTAEGQGSTFTMVLPIAPPQGRASQGEPA